MSDIVNKIKKLLALAGDKAATEDEAATALRMAQGLMLKHQLSEKDLTLTEAQAKELRKKHPLQKHELALVFAAARLFGCEGLVYNRGAAGYSFFGRPENCEAAGETLLFLCSQVERLYKANLSPGLTKKMRAEYRRTFKFACSSRVAQRSIEIMRDTKAMASAAGSTALVVRSHYEHLIEEAKKIMPEYKELKVTSHSGSGTKDGRRAGNEVRLRRELAG